jgi:hypothetical protein
MTPKLPNGTLAYRVSRLEQAEGTQDMKIDRLAEKIDKLTLAIVGAALTFAVSVAVFAITLLATKGKT